MNDLPDDIINKISDYLFPCEFLKFTITSQNIYRVCKKKKHIVLHDYLDFGNFFFIEDKINILSINNLSILVHSNKYTYWLSEIVKSDDLVKCQVVWNLVWKVIVSKYYINTYCPTRYDHKKIVSVSRYFRDLIQQRRIQKGKLPITFY